jgi:seryl-tRNA synthetase
MTAMMKDYIQVKKELKQLKTEHAELKREHKSLQDRVSKHLPKKTLAEYFFNQ